MPALARITAVCAITLLVVGCSGQTPVPLVFVKPHTSAWSRPPSAVPHAFIIMMENKSDSQIVGSPDAPYINSLITRYSFAAQYVGVTHPSLPNYIATIAGNYFGSSSDDPAQRFSAPSIVDQLEAHRLTWKAYMENLPYPGYDGDFYPTSGTALYARRHDPFMMMTRILNRPARRQRVVPLTQLASDLAKRTVPALAYITPNLCHDMHGIAEIFSPCIGDSALIQDGDVFLSHLIPVILHSSAWTGDSVIFVIWDESKGPGISPSPAIIIARQGKRHYTSSATYSHYSLLKTLQVVWHLGCLAHTCNAKQVSSMVEFLASRG